MARIVFSLVLALSVVWPNFGAAAAGEGAQALRAKSGLTEFSASEAFLSGNFVADEVSPRFIFGKVKDFVATRACPTSWLIEAAEKKRLDSAGTLAAPLEYTLFLEEDCPGKVTHYVFIDRSQINAVQWMDWRRQFHKGKTDGQYTAAKDGLEKALQSGFPVGAELRFIETGGDLLLVKPEAFVLEEKKLAPLYDLSQGVALAK
jgi:hypothetical protein